MAGEESEGSKESVKYKKIRRKETKADDEDIDSNHDVKEAKVGSKKQDKAKKKEVEDTNVVELIEERESDSLDIGANNVIEKAAVVSMKHEKKKKKEKENDNREICMSRDGAYVSAQEPEKIKDVDKNEKEGHNVSAKDMKKRKKKKEERIRNNWREDSSSSLELQEDCGKGSCDEREANIEAAESADNEGSKESGGSKSNKAKRKREKCGFELETDGNPKKVKQVLETESKDIAQDGTDEMPSKSKKNVVKKDKKKRRKNGAAKGVESPSEGTSSKEMHDRVEKAGEDKISGKNSSVRKNKGTNDRKASKSSKDTRRVSFSGQVEVFPIIENTDQADDGKDADDQKDGLVRGKRFSLEEDEQIIKAVEQYIQTNQLGEEGLNMILNCKSYPQVKGCWKEIGESLPHRPLQAVYYRAHIIFERSKKRKWEPEEYETLKSFHEKHGPDWKSFAKDFGKHRIHVKDAWRRIRLPTSRKGQWSQDELQVLFDLVNLDLKLKAFEEKKTKHGMLRDNISWEAISQKLTTRYNVACCMKWYRQLTSPLVSEGVWSDSDDYRLMNALQQVDACCVEDVDWDNLLEHRPGEICRKRWNQMIRHIGGYKEHSFVEQVDLLSKRYCPEMVDYRQ